MLYSSSLEICYEIISQLGQDSTPVSSYEAMSGI